MAASPSASETRNDPLPAVEHSGTVSPSDNSAEDLRTRACLITDVVVNYSGPVISSVVGLLTVPIVLHGLGAETFGAWVAVLALASFCDFLDFGLEFTVTREVASAMGTGERRCAITLVNSAASVYLVAAGVGMLLVVVVGVPFRHLLVKTSSMSLPPAIFVACGIAFGANHILRFVTAVLEGLRRFELTNLLMVASSILRNGTIAVLVLLGAGLGKVAVAHAFASCIVMTIGVAALARTAPQFCLVRFEWGALRRHLRFTLLSQLSMALNRVVWDSAPALIALIGGPVLATPLYIGQRFPLMFALLVSRSGGVFFPAAAEQNEGDRGAFVRVLEWGTRWNLMLAAPVLLVFAIAAPAILSAWVGRIGAAEVTIMRISTVAVLAEVAGLAALQVLWAAGRMRTIVGIHSIMAVVMLTTMLLLGPRLGPSSAALGLLLAVLVGSIAFLYCVRSVGGGASWRSCWRSTHGLGGAALACAVVAWLLNSAHIATGYASVALTSGAAALVYVIVLWWSGAHREAKQLYCPASRA